MSVIVFFLVLFVLILVHELGHFLAAKRFGIKVDEFGIGFPPKAVGYRPKGSETEYTFNWLPIGGFVKIFGEDPNEENTDGPDRERSFVHKPKWQQAIVLVAGVTMNVLLAWGIFVVLFMTGMPTAVTPEIEDRVRDVRLVVLNVLPESPAAVAGVKASDVIVSVVDERGNMPDALTPDAIIAFVSERGGEEVAFTLSAGAETRTAIVTPQQGIIEEDPTRAAVGVNMSRAGILRLAPHEALWRGTQMTADLLGSVTVGLYVFFKDALMGAADFSQVAGPVGIVGMVGEASSLGLVYLLTFTAFISLNLAVINMLPFPALDGGRLVFVAWEAITGKMVKPVVANTLNTVGFALLILLMVAVTYNDIVRLFL